MAEPLFSGRKLAKGISTVGGDPNCIKCGLDHTCKTPRVGVTGNGEQGILLLGDVPSKNDSKATEYLRKALKALGVDYTSGCWRLNAVSCKPPKGRFPTPIEIECCRPLVMSAISRKQPKKIIVIGSSGLESILGHRWKHEQLHGKNKEALIRWRGHATPDRDLKTWLHIIYHPSHVLRSEKELVIVNTFKRDLRKAVKHIPPDIDWDFDPESKVQILNDTGKIKQAIRQYRNSGELVSFDYEATGLKLHAKGHKLYTASMATPLLGAVSFPLYPDIMASWVRFLVSVVLKTAHNLKYEESAAHTKLAIRTLNWAICTMQAAHVLDNRKGITSLEFQSYVRLGFAPWGIDIKRYLKGVGDRGANNINRIHEAPIKQLLLYGGLDSLMQSMLAHLPEFKELWIK